MPEDRTPNPLGRPDLLCLTPVKNEEWILRRFLKSATGWADQVILADQLSIDSTREIAKQFDKVRVIKNDNPAYDEGARQTLLLNAARENESANRRVLLALDADEMLSSNWRTSDEWQKLLTAESGTVLAFYWVNLLPGCDKGWLSPEPIPFGFVDDGSSHVGEVIHSRRLPVPEHANWMIFKDIRVLHYQYTNWNRMKSKQRWYQCWERINHPQKRPITIFRQYHHMDSERETAFPTDPSWFSAQDGTLDMIPETHYARDYTWDDKVREIISEAGTEVFRKLDIWDSLLTSEGAESPILSDPRNAFEKLIHRWLRRTQPRHDELDVRIIQKLLQIAGW